MNNKTRLKTRCKSFFPLFGLFLANAAFGQSWTAGNANFFLMPRTTKLGLNLPTTTASAGMQRFTIGVPTGTTEMLLGSYLSTGSTGNSKFILGAGYETSTALSYYGGMEVRQGWNATTSVNTTGIGFVTSSGTTKTENMTLVPGGKVGIGVTGPAEMLDVKGRVKISDGANGILTLWGDDKGGVIMLGKMLGGQRDLRFVDQTSDVTKVETERARLTSDGKFGIGTASPAAKLDVSGSILARGVGVPTTGIGVEIDYGGVANLGRIIAYDRGAGVYKAMRLGNSFDVQPNGDVSGIRNAGFAGDLLIGGKVGIGTTTLNHALTIKSQIPTTDYPIDVQNSVGKDVIQAGKSAEDGVLYVNDRNGTAQVQIYSWGASYFNAGNFGIGNAAPPNKLTIGSNTATSQETKGITLGSDQQNIEFVNSTSTSGYGSKIYGVDEGSGSTSLRIATRNNTATWTDRFDVNSKTGNVGIGTTNPSAYLHVSGAGVGSGVSGIDITNQVSPGRTFKISAGIKDVSEAGFTITDRTAGDVSRLAIDNNGNVGIGQVHPQAKLHVAGTAKIDGELTAASIKTQVWTVAPDYVFEKGYRLSTLDNVEKFVNTHKHLPEIPSAMEIKRDGLDLAEMNLKLLKKVEELTLYSIQQNKKIEALNNRLNKVEGNGIHR